mmetsp:Transcript_23743/g.23431  ORF Transcript_23743/g.23431 Transcript_23743/m.23431 type:complete len:109 (-) Transcript_23743:852-1178(-)
MTHSHLMNVLNSLCNLLEDSPALLFSDPSLVVAILYILLKADSIDILHHQVNVLAVFNKLEHFDYVGVIHLLEGSNFSLDSLLLHGVIEPVLVVDLQGVLLLGLLVGY